MALTTPKYCTAFSTNIGHRHSPSAVYHLLAVGTPVMNTTSVQIHGEKKYYPAISAISTACFEMNDGGQVIMNPAFTGNTSSISFRPLRTSGFFYD
jgi:hypothetical protein